ANAEPSWLVMAQPQVAPAAAVASASAVGVANRPFPTGTESVLSVGPTVTLSLVSNVVDEPAADSGSSITVTTCSSVSPASRRTAMRAAASGLADQAS